MSILITGIDMPTKGNPITVLIYPDGTAEWEAQNKAGIAVPVPPHGRLIDADALMEIIKAHDYPLRAHFNSTDNGMFTIGIQQAVDDAPTIIPASGGNEDE